MVDFENKKAAVIHNLTTTLKPVPYLNTRAEPRYKTEHMAPSPLLS